MWNVTVHRQCGGEINKSGELPLSACGNLPETTSSFRDIPRMQLHLASNKKKILCWKAAFYCGSWKATITSNTREVCAIKLNSEPHVPQVDTEGSSLKRLNVISSKIKTGLRKKRQSPAEAIRVSGSRHEKKPEQPQAAQQLNGFQPCLMSRPSVHIMYLWLFSRVTRKL